MSRVILPCLAGLWMAGCAYNDSEIHLYMTQHEMDAAMAERYCIGMNASAVEQQLESDRLVFFVNDTGAHAVARIEARVLPAGLARQTRPPFGRLFFGFDAEGLDELLYAVPDRESGSGWYPPREIPLERCEQEGASP